MVTIDGKQYRNLQEQVLKNQDDIEILKNTKNISDLGINIIQPEPLDSATDLPTDYAGEYGDAYLVGTEAPYDLYIWTRSNQTGVPGYWFDWGPLNAPSTVPGPIGPQGIQGETGVRGSRWTSQSGAPIISPTLNQPLPYDQALDTITGDTYQCVQMPVNNQLMWQKTGNIRGPQGIQGPAGPVGPEGPIGQTGPQGAKGDQGQFIQIIGTLENINQLPMPDSVPRYSAYLIPIGGTNHVYLLVGEGTTTSPIEWTDGGSFGGGSNVTIDGVSKSDVELGYVPKISVNYQIGEDTTVTTNGSEVTFSNMQTTGYNVDNEQIEGTASIELPIASSEQIQVVAENNTISFKLTDAVLEEFQDIADSVKPQEVQITAPTTSTNGQLTAAQLATLQGNSGAYLMFNNEIYRLQDTQHISGYLVYSHLGYENTTQTYMIKCITITISTRGWVLTTRTVVNGSDYVLKTQLPKNYVHTITGIGTTSSSTNYITLINDNSNPITTIELLQEAYVTSYAIRYYPNNTTKISSTIVSLNVPDSGQGTVIYNAGATTLQSMNIKRYTFTDTVEEL